MRRLPLLFSGVILSASLALAGCATGAGVAGGGSEEEALTPTPAEMTESTRDAGALGQALAWLAAVSLPPGAVVADVPASYNSWTGWPCGPYEELEENWVVPDTTVIDAANWMIENPTAGLISTRSQPLTDHGTPMTSASVGFIPFPEAQEGIVFTYAKRGDDVTIRAEVAAQVEGATCPPLPDGSMYGAPGMG